MPIFHTNGKNVLFVHIPKTGGTSVEKWLRRHVNISFFSIGVPSAMKCTPQHLTNHDFFQIFGKGYFDYTFAIVRNPFDRIVSEYRMREAEGNAGFWGAFPEFSLWLEENLPLQTRDPWRLDNHLRPQWEFISSDTEVFRFEDGLENIMRSVADRVGLPPPDDVPHEMGRPLGPTKLAWDERDILKMRIHYGQDFSHFGYSDTPRT
ncbi:sulfotransferase family protein [Rhodoblastus acidophilus]|uniref:Sulfotransferase family protein n=1 Tax=Candidatus Rhodoblastus alkanivorans TaxID=2954117 RepID=A0ABS9ZA24_9HYPH|nr:sulfotransferase family 2 domain-containing protein [Candidatus Rhodoblastus alkanivorans]MCI4679804.1 sulfotransferase family protein [Candidatus Rhodoblastus alkanivorans]MCI4684276.1 sulfotransferase family protein [Candidatus Rhodoblastus alkanivorans]MDI4641596.1 sulfotransferase family protein [Rhodoblastus acidophilus]